MSMIPSRNPFPEFVDTWRIREVGDFPLDEIDQLGKAVTQFDLNGFGEHRFRRVKAEMDCRYNERVWSHCVKLTWFRRERRKRGRWVAAKIKGDDGSLSSLYSQRVGDCSVSSLEKY